MIVLLGSQKGGCGKSTLATNMAAALSHNSDVVLLDADSQGTSANWVNDRNETEAPTVHCVQRSGNITATVRDLAERYEQVVIDAAGRDSQELRTALTIADIVICPFRPSQADVDTIFHLSVVIDTAKDFNSTLRVLGVLTLCPTHPANTEIEDSREYLSEHMEVIPSIVCDRKAYRDALSEGLSVVEYNNPKAKQEINDLVGFIYG
jgi:chromosome partitioning protein